MKVISVSWGIEAASQHTWGATHIVDMCMVIIQTVLTIDMNYGRRIDIEY